MVTRLAAATGPASLSKRWVLQPDEFLRFSEREMTAPKDQQWWQEDSAAKRDTMLRAVTSALQHTDTDDDVAVHRSDAVIARTVDILVSDLLESLHAFPDLSSLHSPVDIWYGDYDEAAPHGDWLAQRIPNCRAMRCEGYGHQLVFTLLPAILERLIEAVPAS
jgi:pimeloyl-ACP methyl ester carboxylesterase